LEEVAESEIKTSEDRAQRGVRHREFEVTEMLEKVRKRLTSI